jgi:hypothetical protein
MTAKEILYTKCKKGFFSDFEEVYMLEAMEDYKNISVKTLEGIIELKEKERRQWADMVIKKQARIEELESKNQS